LLFEKTYLGIEFGSTRIKAVLIDDTYSPVATGVYDWENRFENGYWTYSIDDIHKGMQGCYASLKENIKQKFGVTLTTVGAIGISGMMHGYLPFDKEDNLLAKFRTWRNTTTGEAAEYLTELFNFNIPQRWSIAHLYQAILNKEEHTKNVAKITTLAGYIHYRLTGEHCLGVGEASGMFPISNGTYDGVMFKKFDKRVKELGYSWDIKNLLPKVLSAGQIGGYLTEEGALFIDPEGDLKAGIPLCAPEGDAGTGMVATNSVEVKTGNISAGTSIFSMLVLEENLKGIYPEIDVVTTPDGSPVAMVHGNNCCSEIDAFVNMFGEFAEITGNKLTKSELYESLYKHALNGDNDCGGVTAYNYLSGEFITGVENGRPMYYRMPDSNMNLANFIKAQLYSTMATLKIGMDILFEKEKVSAEQFKAHGGLFKVKGVAQQILANALNTTISVTETSGEGGAWGIALLAAFMMNKNVLSLSDWLNKYVFCKMEICVVQPEKSGVEGFVKYTERYIAGLNAAKALSDVK